jgi:hypothetical protein
VRAAVSGLRERCKTAFPGALNAMSMCLQSRKGGAALVEFVGIVAGKHATSGQLMIHQINKSDFVGSSVDPGCRESCARRALR